ncbi:MAG: pyridoxal phosphate-dependent aminotransferase [Candidatus Aenigmarchaeota archaeon]|nr:pyridoxal phosphate-dependent aminotransferase [Candidatus Aenigmarchaeota archaeon]
MKDSNVPESGKDIREILGIALKRKDVISLAIGEPDFPTPKSVIDATKESLDNGTTNYSQPNGVPELRHALVKKLREENGIDSSEDDIIVTCGSSEALFIATFAAMKPGEKTLIPDPGYMDYSEVVRMLNGTPVPTKLSNEGFSFDSDILRKTIDEKTRILFLNSPSNPTGTVMSKREMEEIADIATENNMLIFSDEAYEKYVYDNEKHYSIGSMNGMEDKVVTFNTFSKTYSMPGFRLGYCKGPSDMIKKMIQLKFAITVSSPAFLQHGAVEALKIPEKDIQKNVNVFDDKRKFASKRLKEIGFDFIIPKGAFYIFFRTLGGMKSQEFSEFLIREAKVLTVPGNQFGSSGEGFIRMSYATSKDKISDAMDKIEMAVRKIK